MTIEEQMKQIVLGKTYPTYVAITEADGNKIEFHLNSFYVGMYCAIHVNGEYDTQTGDYDNTGVCEWLKQDILEAIKRNAIVEIGSIRKCQLELSA